MRPLFTPHQVTTAGTATTAEVTAPHGDPRFHGFWAHAALPAHRNAFSPSDAYGRNGWELARASSPNNAWSYGSDPPPFDRDRPRRTDETMASYRARLDTRRSEETAEQHWARLSVTLEKDMTLNYGLNLRNSISRMANEQSLAIRVIMTRTEPGDNPGIVARANFARDHGADNFLSIHFNSDHRDWLRGPEVLVRHQNDGNQNLAEDNVFAQRIQTVLDAIPDAPGRNDRQITSNQTNGYRGTRHYTPPPSVVDNDERLGNLAMGPASHACLAEIEFITSSDFENILVPGDAAETQRQGIADGFADAIRRDILARQNER